MALGLTQFQTKNEYQKIFVRSRSEPVRKADYLTVIFESIV
jgi:hypothetical protein